MSQARINIAVRKPADKLCILDIQGEISGFAEEAFGAALDAASSNAADTIILNCTGVESMNSAGVGLLIVLLARVQLQKQRLLAYGLGNRHQQAFELAQLSEAIGLYADEDEALRSLGR